MPIYEYRCRQCGNLSEYLVGIGDDDPIRCKHCGSLHMSRILSAASFTLPSSQRAPGRTCCGREERCERPPCSEGGACRRD
jgi:putative FmdB family regulatory protein